MKLLEGYLNQERDFFVDNWYTELNLAKMLIDRKTNLIDTCRRYRKELSVNVVKKKLKRGDILAQQNKDGIIICHNATVSFNLKPIVVKDYNKAKLFVVTSDQMAF